MRMRRLLALAAVAATVALAAPADAKPYTYTDPKDMPAHAGLDIVGVTYSTEGTTTVTKVRGKKVKRYEPTKLLATMTLAGAPLEQAGVKYKIGADVSDCGTFNFTWAPAIAGESLSSGASLTVGCGGPAGTTGGDTLFLDPKVTVKGSKIIFSIPLKSLPKVARAGAVLYKMESTVDVTEPALGTLGPGDFGPAVMDTATSMDDWEIS